MEQLHETASQISEAVQLSRHPVAIKFIDDLEAFRDKPTARGHPFCQLVMRARQLVQEKNRILLAAFVGSDWCPWRQKLESEIFTQPEFKDFARDRFVLFQADFPKHKELPADQKNQNQELMNQYAVKKFPTVLFLDVEGKEIGRMGYLYGGVPAYLEAIKGIIPQAFQVKKEAPGYRIFPSFQYPPSP
jgi:thioredoxin-related protein